MLEMPKGRADTITGRLTCHPDGYGFVIPDDPTVAGDVFIPPKKMRNATHGDQVTVRLTDGHTPRRGRQARSSLEGEVVKVVSRARDVLVGRVFHYKDEVYVAPLDPRYHYTIRLVDETGDS